MLPIINKNNTANRIKYLMKLNNMKPDDIKKYLGLTCVQTVYRWLEGINIPTVDNLYALSQLFNIRMDDMIVGNRKYAMTRLPDSFQRRIYVYSCKFLEMETH